MASEPPEHPNLVTIITDLTQYLESPGKPGLARTLEHERVRGARDFASNYTQISLMPVANFAQIHSTLIPTRTGGKTEAPHVVIDEGQDRRRISFHLERPSLDQTLDLFDQLDYLHNRLRTMLGAATTDIAGMIGRINEIPKKLNTRMAFAYAPGEIVGDEELSVPHLDVTNSTEHGTGHSDALATKVRDIVKRRNLMVEDVIYTTKGSLERLLGVRTESQIEKSLLGDENRSENRRYFFEASGIEINVNGDGKEYLVAVYKKTKERSEKLGLFGGEKREKAVMTRGRRQAVLQKQNPRYEEARTFGQGARGQQEIVRTLREVHEEGLITTELFGLRAEHLPEEIAQYLAKVGQRIYSLWRTPEVWENTHPLDLDPREDSEWYLKLATDRIAYVGRNMSDEEREAMHARLLTLARSQPETFDKEAVLAWVTGHTLRRPRPEGGQLDPSAEFYFFLDTPRLFRRMGSQHDIGLLLANGLRKEALDRTPLLPDGRAVQARELYQEPLTFGNIAVVGAEYLNHEGLTQETFPAVGLLKLLSDRAENFAMADMQDMTESAAAIAYVPFFVEAGLRDYSSRQMVCQEEIPHRIEQKLRQQLTAKAVKHITSQYPVDVEANRVLDYVQGELLRRHQK